MINTQRLGLTLLCCVVLAVGLASPVRGSQSVEGGCAPPTKKSESGILLGPLRIPVFSSGTYAQIRFRPGYPTKVLLRPTRRWSGTLVLRGVQCTDGRQLRFAYHHELLPEPPLTDEQLGALGSPAAHLSPPSHVVRLSRFGYTGYMLFSEPGEWRIRAFRHGRLVATVFVSVMPFNG